MLIPEADGFEETWREKVREKKDMAHFFEFQFVGDKFWIFSISSTSTCGKARISGSHFDIPARQTLTTP